MLTDREICTENAVLLLFNIPAWFGRRGVLHAAYRAIRACRGWLRFYRTQLHANRRNLQGESVADVNEVAYF